MNEIEIANTNQMSVQMVKQQFDLVQDLYRSIMIKGEHYGIIPGTKKDTLLKSGAEKLNLLFKLVPKIEMENKIDLGDGHREIEMNIGLYHKETGQLWGQGTGSCSTMESKFRYRKVNGKRVDNPDIADIYNTVRKMAYKRALVSATITATGVSDIFTQDIEDMNPADLGNKKPEYSLEQRQAEAKQKYEQFWNSLDDGYHFELKDMDERERFILFQNCKWDTKILDEKIAEMAQKLVEEQKPENPFSDADIPF